ncbi:beta-1,6-N-acetylglucosaminyltransferase [Pedobacter sp. BG31]|uniref:beta-1,6-N-acetylglucosaminyltransferase n=1 Tax=Pedobacter sp. BG31 TaxID=3349697 RepID=UPI0035F3B293
MNLTYIILAHNDHKHLERLISSLYADGVTFVIHIDRRVDISLFEKHFTHLDMKSIFFVKRRFSSDWGSFSIVEATLSCLKFVYNKLPLTDRVSLMSGHDYPIKNNQYIHAYFKANPMKIFIDFNKVPYRIWWNGGKDRFPSFKEIDNIMGIYAGSQWFSLPKYALKIIFDFIKLNPKFMEYFRAVDIPDESFFQTLFLNCGEKIVGNNLVKKNLHLIKWDFPYRHPRYFNEFHFNLIRKSRSLFARKFSAEIPSKILDKIDFELLSKKNKIQKRLSQNGGSKDCVVLFLTNKDDSSTLDTFRLIKTEIPECHDLRLLYHQGSKQVPKFILLEDPFLFTDEILKSIGFKSIYDKLVPGSNHFPLFMYASKNPDYKYYWYIEDDVRFNGRWNTFFNSIQESEIDTDFLTCHVRRYKDEPNWFWWETLKHTSGERIALDLRLRSFNPIFRISKRALDFLNKAYLSGWSGHHEVSIASLLSSAGFLINDLGEVGEFVLPKTKKYYKSAFPDRNGDVATGSVRFRPLININEMMEEILYHPVKVTNNYEEVSLKKSKKRETLR